MTFALHFSVLLFTSVQVCIHAGGGDGEGTSEDGIMAGFQPPTKDVELADQGRYLVKKKKYEKALEIYEGAIDTCVQRQKKLTQIASHFLTNSTVDRKTDKLIDFQPIREKEGSSVTSFYGLRGICNLEKGESHEKVMEDFMAMISQAKSSEEVLILNDDELTMIANEFSQREMKEEAVWCVTEAIKKNPRQPENYRLRAFLNNEIGNKDMAIQDYQELLRLDGKNNEDARYRVSVLLCHAKRFEEAMKEILHSKKVEWFTPISKCFLDFGRFKEAIFLFIEGIKREWSSRERYYKMLDEYFEKWRLSEISIIQKKKLITSQEADKWFDYATALIQAKKFNEAVEEMIKMNNPLHLSYLGEELYKHKRFEDAIRCYNEALNRNPDDSTTLKRCYEGLGTCYWELEDFENSTLYFEKAFELNSDGMSLRARHYFVGVLEAVGRHDEAEKVLHDLDKLEETIRQNLQEVEEEVKDIDERIKELEEKKTDAINRRRSLTDDVMELTSGREKLNQMKGKGTQ